MTRPANARLAGFTFLFYIAAGIATMAVGKNPHAVGLLALLTSFSALVLGVTLYSLTRHVDQDLALMGLICRAIEAIPGQDGQIFFAVGSTLFAWLFLRGRLVPVALAWLGVGASALLAVVLPLQGAGLLGGAVGWSSPITWAIWFPALIYELTIGSWLLTRGVAAPPPSPVR